MPKPRHTQPGLMDPPNKATADPAQQQWQAQLTQVLRTGLGQSKDTSGKFLTWTDLESEGIVISEGGSHAVNPDSGSGLPGTGGGTAPEEDRTPPPAPKNFTADGGMTAIYLNWDNPNLDYNYRVEIHRSSIDDLGTAVLHGSGIGTIYQDVVGSDKTRYFYWSRFVKQLTTDIIIGPWNKTEGTPAQAAEDSEWVLDQISGKFDADDLKTQVFAVDLFGVKSTDPNVERMSFAIDNTVTPPQVAMDGAYIINATINDAKIADLTVDKLIGGTADFVEANIRDGSITNAKIGNYIQSENFQTGVAGWQINKSGRAEFMDIDLRGTVYATGGEFHGTIYAEEILGDVYKTYMTSPAAVSFGTSWVDLINIYVEIERVACYISISPIAINQPEDHTAYIEFYVDGARQDLDNMRTTGGAARQMFSELNTIGTFKGTVNIRVRARMSSSSSTIGSTRIRVSTFK